MSMYYTNIKICFFWFFKLHKHSAIVELSFVYFQQLFVVSAINFQLFSKIYWEYCNSNKFIPKYTWLKRQKIFVYCQTRRSKLQIYPNYKSKCAVKKGWKGITFISVSHFSTNYRTVLKTMQYLRSLTGKNN